MKLLSKILLASYLAVLLWLVLFKLSFDLLGVLDFQQSSLNLIPFANSAGGLSREMIDNLIVFIPLGLLLGINLKRADFWEKLGIGLIISLVVEMLQFILAIGVTDITDVIMNTLGGFIGLALYSLASKCINEKRLDQFIVIVGMVLLVSLVMWRVLFLHVRY